MRNKNSSKKNAIHWLNFSFDLRSCKYCVKSVVALFFCHIRQDYHLVSDAINCVVSSVYHLIRKYILVNYFWHFCDVIITNLRRSTNKSNCKYTSVIHFIQRTIIFSQWLLSYSHRNVHFVHSFGSNLKALVHEFNSLFFSVKQIYQSNFAKVTSLSVCVLFFTLGQPIHHIMRYFKFATIAAIPLDNLHWALLFFIRIIQTMTITNQVYFCVICSVQNVDVGNNWLFYQLKDGAIASSIIKDFVHLK